MFKKRTVKKDLKRKLEFGEDTEESNLKKGSGDIRHGIRGKRIGSLEKGQVNEKSDDKEISTEFGSKIGSKIGSNNGLKDNSTHSKSELETKLVTKNDTVMDTKKDPVLSAIPVNIRTTTITDFQPDVCKDFQQTGYCGYGDTCKFLHIRSETRAKKPVVREWETVSNNSNHSSTISAAKDSEIPFKCVLCKDDYKSPIKTVCGHVYCRGCFSKRYGAKKSCFICGKATDGIMSPISAQEMKKLVSPEN